MGLCGLFCGLPTSLPLTCPLTSTAQHTMRLAPLPGRPPATCRHVWPLLWAWAQYRCAGWVVHLAAPWAAGLGYAETSVLRCAARCCCRGWDCFPGSPHCPRQGCQLRPAAGFGPNPQLLRSSALHAFDTCIQYNSTNCRQGVLEGWYNKQKVEEQEAAAKGEPCLGCCCLQLLRGLYGVCGVRVPCMWVAMRMAFRKRLACLVRYASATPSAPGTSLSKSVHGHGQVSEVLQCPPSSLPQRRRSASGHRRLLGTTQQRRCWRSCKPA